MFLSYFRIALIPLFLVAAHPDTGRRCQDDAADHAMDSLTTWRDLRAWWETYFPECDDGYIAEGISDTVAQWLAKDWSTLPRLRKELRGRPQFLRFVIEHIDASDARDDLEKIIENAEQRCPPDATSLCKSFAAQARSALKE